MLLRRRRISHVLLLAVVACGTPKWLRESPNECSHRCSSAAPSINPSGLPPLRCEGYRVLSSECPDDVSTLKSCHDTAVQRVAYAGGGNSNTSGDFYWAGNICNATCQEAHDAAMRAQGLDSWEPKPAHDLAFEELCVSLTGECSTNAEAGNCMGRAVYRKVEEASGQLGCDNAKVIPLLNHACPKAENYHLLVHAGCDTVPWGHLCYGDGDCGTEADLSNCGFFPGITHRGGLRGESIYVKIEFPDWISAVRTSTITTTTRSPKLVSLDAPQLHGCSEDELHFNLLWDCQIAANAMEGNLAYGRHALGDISCNISDRLDVRMTAATAEMCSSIARELTAMIFGEDIAYETNPMLSTQRGFTCDDVEGTTLKSSSWSWDTRGDCLYVLVKANFFLQTMWYGAFATTAPKESPLHTVSVSFGGLRLPMTFSWVVGVLAFFITS